MRKIAMILCVALLAPLLSSISVTAQSGRMKFLVEADYIDPGPLMPQDQAMKMIDAAIIPSLDMLAKWETDGKISGGIVVGARRGVFVVTAESNEEVDKMLQSLPFWGLLKWNVTPLHTFKGRADQEREWVKTMSSGK